MSSTQIPVGRENDVQWCHTFSYWEFKVFQVEVTAMGYFRKMEAEVMEKIRPGEFRWYGFLLPEEYDDQGRLLYRILDPVAENQPALERDARN